MSTENKNIRIKGVNLVTTADKGIRDERSTLKVPTKNYIEEAKLRLNNEEYEPKSQK